MDLCPNCGAELGLPFRIDSKIMKKFLNLNQSLSLNTKFRITDAPVAKRSRCRQFDCPHEGKFGKNIISLATLFRYEDRLPHRKIQDALKRLYGLKISPATILDLTRRAADAVRSEYDAF